MQRSAGVGQAASQAADKSADKAASKKSLAAWHLSIVYLGYWAYILIGAAILRSIENRSFHRQDPPPPPPPPLILTLIDNSTIEIQQRLVNAKGQPYLFYPQLAYIDAVYWVVVFMATVGTLLSANYPPKLQALETLSPRVT